MTTDDEAFDRLRASDPALGTEPDTAAITAAVAAATGVPLAAAATEQVPDELAARRPRRTEWVRMAAAVAALAVAITGGYLAASAASGSSATAGGGAPNALPAITLNDTGGGDEVGNGSVMTAEGIGSSATSPSDGAALEPLTPGSQAAAGMAVKDSGGRVVFAGQGLSTVAGSAQAWAFDASKVTTSSTAARIAKALGVAGEPRVEGGQWIVGPNDGSGSTVTLGSDGSLWFTDPRFISDQCGSAPPVAPVRPDPSVCRTGTTPMGDAAVTKALAVLASIGVDTTGATAVANTGTSGWNIGKANPGWSDQAYVQVRQAVDGQETGLEWDVTLSGVGVMSIQGSVAPLVSLGDYPLISPAAAVDRLNDPRFGASGGLGSAPGAITAEGEATPPPGASIPSPVQYVTLVSAKLGVAVTYRADGSQLLVPTYRLTDTTGGTWSVIAVADDHLDFGTN
jgi:hypothetical protein